jgi:gliding motility-associated-like protein
VSHPQKVNAYAGETKCGASTGYIKANALSEDLDAWYVVTPNNDTLDQPIGNTFPNLGAGDYSVYYIDSLGCKSEDTIVNIETYNNTVADFSVNPTTGSAPLEVEINNLSQNATDYEWLINGVSIGTSPTTFFDTSGIYQIGLIAWEIDASCADTTWKTVFVYDSLVARIPNVFTPGGDGINDYFGITVNFTVETELVILNRWGNVVFQWSGLLVEGQNDLWDGQNNNGELVTDGVYFYRIEFKGLEGKEKERKMSGYLHVFGGE